MSENKQRYIYINGEEIAVSRRVYLEFMRPIWAESKRRERESRCRDEKGNRCTKDCQLCDKQRDGGVLSLNKFFEDGYEVANSIDLFEIVTEKILKDKLRSAVSELSDDERRIISLAYSGKSEREAAAELGIPRKTFTYRRDKIVDKLRKIL